MRVPSRDLIDQELYDSGILGRNQVFYLLHRALLWKLTSCSSVVERWCASLGVQVRILAVSFRVS